MIYQIYNIYIKKRLDGVRVSISLISQPCPCRVARLAPPASEPLVVKKLICHVVTIGYAVWCPSSLAKLVYKSKFTMVYLG